MKTGIDGLALGLGNLMYLSSAQSRSISPENLTGQKGRGGSALEGTGKNAARELGRGWKVSPSVRIEPGETRELASIEGPGVIQHIWMTPTRHWRWSILRFYWEGAEKPAVECPVGDFFACGWGKYAQVSSLPVCVNPGAALNCYWPMPFRKAVRVTMTNLGPETMTLYYQIDYSLTEVPESAASFHAQFRRVRHVPYQQDYTILDGVKGQGHYVGTYLAWGVNDTGWWGEGEMKFYLDGDGEFPTICGTGAEDYFCGSYDFNPGNPYLQSGRPEAYVEFTTPYAGLAQVLKPDGLYQSQTRFGLYRWHIMDPIRFQQDLRVTIQDLGWTLDRRYLPRQDDIASVAYWYQTLPAAPFPPLPDKDLLASEAGI